MSGLPLPRHARDVVHGANWPNHAHRKSLMTRDPNDYFVQGFPACHGMPIQGLTRLYIKPKFVYSSTSHVCPGHAPVLPNILHQPVTRRARRSLPLVTCEDRGVACCQPYGLDSDSLLYPKISKNYIYIYIIYIYIYICIHIANSMGKMVIIHWNIFGPTQFPFAIPCAHQATNHSPIESFCLILGYTMVQPIFDDYM